jgi:hypothetical protein
MCINVGGGCIEKLMLFPGSNIWFLYVLYVSACVKDDAIILSEPPHILSGLQTFPST